MKRFFIALLISAILMCLPAIAETANVTIPQELTEALNNDAVDVIEITADMTITSVTEDASFVLTKDVTIAEDVNVVFRPAPDDGFFVKSLTIPESVTLTVRGNLATVSTFEGGFAIAQVYLNGGTLDVREGAVSDDCNICFDSGTLLPPADGFGANVAVARYLYENVTEDMITDALAADILKNVTVQTECTVGGIITVPGDKVLQISAILTVSDGAAIDGSVSVDADCGFILEGSGHVNDITKPDEMASCLVIWAEDGSYTITEYTE